MDKKRLLVMVSAGVALSVIVSTCTLLISSAATGAFSFGSYAFDSGTTVDLQNYETNIVKIDGNLNDGVWKHKNWLECSTADVYNAATLKLTAYMGSKGVYIAVDVKDNGVYYRRSRGPSYNSGVELYIAPTGLTSCEQKAYEIDLDAGNDYSISRFSNGNYTTYPSQLLLATHLDGTLNSAKCKGYQLEAFIPYASIGLDGAVSKLNICASLIRTSTDELAGTDSTNERTWANMGMLYHSDYQWGNPSSWYMFDNGGLVESKLSVQSNGGGKVEGITKDLIAGDSYVLGATADSGKVLDSLQVNGEDLAYKLKPSSGSTAQLTILQAPGDLNVQAKFEDIPGNQHTVVGKVNVPAGLNVSNVTAYLQKGTYIQTVTLDQNGKFTASVPAMDGIYLITKLDGCDVSMRRLDFSQANQTVTVNLQTSTYGGVGKLTQNGSFDLDFVDNNEVSFASSAYQTDSGRAYIYLTQSAQTNQVVAADIKFPKAGLLDLHQGFVFTQVVNGSTRSLFVSIFWDAENNEFKIQKVSNPGDGNLSYEDVPLDTDQSIIQKLQAGKSVRLTVTNGKGQIGVFCDGELFDCSDKSSFFDGNEPVTVGLETWNTKAVFQNISFRTGSDAVSSAYNAFCPFINPDGMDVSKAGPNGIITVTGAVDASNMATYYKKFDNFVFETTLKHKYSGTDARQGIMVKFQNSDGTFDFYEISLLVGFNNDVNNARFQLLGGIYPNSHNLVPDNLRWFSIQLPQNLKEEYLNGKGIDVKLIRNGNTLLSSLDGHIVRTDTYPSIGSREAQVSIVSRIPGAAYSWKVNDSASFGMHIEDAANGSVTCAKTQYSYGDPFTLNVQAKPGYKLVSLLVDGAERVNDVSKGKLTVSDYGGSSDLIVRPTFARIHYVPVTFIVSKTDNGLTANASGATVSFKDSKGNITSGRVDGNRCTLTLDQDLAGTYSVSLNGYDTATGQMKVTGSTWKIVLQKAIFNQSSGFDLSQQGSQIMPVWSSNSSSNAVMATYAGLSNKTRYIVSATFRDIRSTGKRQGFIFNLGSTSFAMTILYDTNNGHPGWMLQSAGGLDPWTVWYAFKDSDAGKSMIADYTTTSGLPITVVRNGSVFDIYLNGTFVKSIDVGSTYANQTGDVQIESNDGLTEPIFVADPVASLPSLSVSSHVSGSGSVTFDKAKYSYGDNVIMNVTPADGYYLKNLNVNGTDVTSRVSENALKCTKDMYQKTGLGSFGVNVTAVFAKCSAVCVPVQTVVNGVATNTANATVTFSYSDGSVIKATFANGTYNMEVAPGITGTLTISQSGYDTITEPLTISSNTTISMVKLQRTIFSKSNGFDLSQQGTQITPQWNDPSAVADTTTYAGLSSVTSYTVSATFSDVGGTGKRQGFLFGLGGSDFAMTILYDTSWGHPGWMLQSDGSLNPWTIWYAFNSSNAGKAWISDYTSGKGMTMTVVRNGSVFDVYIDGTLVVTTDIGSVYANQTGDVQIESNSGLTDSIIATEPEAALPSLSVSSTVTGNGSVAFDKTAYTYGDSIVVNATPGDSYYLKSLKINGTDVTSQVSNGAFKCTNALYQKTGLDSFGVNVVAVFEKCAVIGIPVQTVANGVTSDTANAVVVFTAADGSTVQATYANSVYSLVLVPGTTGTLTISQNGYDTTTQSLAALADTIIPTVKLQKTVFDASLSNGFDLSQQGSQITPDWSSSSGSNAVTATYGNLSDKTRYTVSANFSDAGSTGKRQGFIFNLGDSDFAMTILYDTNWGRPGWILQSDGSLDSWTVWYAFNSSDAGKAWISDYTSGKGMTMTVVRNGSVFDVYIDGTLVVSTDVGAGYASLTGNVQIQSNDGLTDPILVTVPMASLASLNVTSSVTGNGSVTPDKTAYSYGDNIVMNVTPSNGYYLKSLTVNGMDVTSQVSNDSFTCTKSYYQETGLDSFGVNVVAVFEKCAVITIPVQNVAGGVTSDTANAVVVFTAADGSTVQATYANGVYSLVLVPGTSGTLTVSQNGYDTVTQPLTVSADTTISAIELQKNIFSSASGFDLSQEGTLITPDPSYSYATATYAGLSDKTSYTVSATFKDIGGTGKRQGFTFNLGDSNFAMTILYDTDWGHPGWMLQSTGGVDAWTVWYAFNSSAAGQAMATDYTSLDGPGVTMTVTRNGSVFDVYLDGTLVVNVDVGSDWASTLMGDVQIQTNDGLSDPIYVTVPES